MGSDMKGWRSAVYSTGSYFTLFSFGNDANANLVSYLRHTLSRSLWCVNEVVRIPSFFMFQLEKSYERDWARKHNVGVVRVKLLMTRDSGKVVDISWRRRSANVLEWSHKREEYVSVLHGSFVGGREMAWNGHTELTMAKKIIWRLWRYVESFCRLVCTTNFVLHCG